MITDRSKREIDTNIPVAGDFNTQCSIKDTSSRKKINKEKVYLSNSIKQVDLTDI